MDGVPRGQPASVRSDQLKEQLAPVLTACLLLIGCCRGKPISWRLLIGCPARAAFNVSLDSQQVLTSLSLGRNGDFPDLWRFMVGIRLSDETSINSMRFDDNCRIVGAPGASNLTVRMVLGVLDKQFVASLRRG